MTLAAFWGLPGPKDFLETCVDALTGGRHVVLHWPPFAPSFISFQQALTERLSHEEVRGASLTPDGATDPLLWLSQHFLPADERPAESVSELLDRAELPGQVLWLHLPDDPKGRERWLRLLPLLAYGTTHLPSYQRPVLITCLAAGERPPPEDNGLKVQPWRQVLDGFDVLSHAMLLLRPRYVGVKRMVYASMLSQVALYDTALLETLAGTQEGSLMDLDALLLAYAEEHHLTPESPRNWHSGTEEQIDQQLRLHSSVKVQCGGIERRLWRGQVNVLLPLLEERRQGYVSRYISNMRFPLVVSWKNDAQTIADPSEIEFKHLIQVAAKSLHQGFNREVPKLIVLKEIRNKLAHLQPISIRESEWLIDQN